MTMQTTSLTPASGLAGVGSIMTGKEAIITSGSQGIGADLVAGYRARRWPSNELIADRLQGVRLANCRNSRYWVGE